MQLWQQKARLERERAKAAATKAWAAEEKAVAKVQGELEGARKALASAAKALEEAKRSAVRWGAGSWRGCYDSNFVKHQYPLVPAGWGLLVGRWLLVGLVVGLVMLVHCCTAAHWLCISGVVHYVCSSGCSSHNCCHP